MLGCMSFAPASSTCPSVRRTRVFAVLLLICACCIVLYSIYGLYDSVSMSVCVGQQAVKKLVRPVLFAQNTCMSGSAAPLQQVQ